MKFFYNPFRAVKAGIRKSLNPARQGVAFDAKLSINNALYMVFALFCEVIPMNQTRLVSAFFVFALSMLVAGCTSIDDVMKSYLGAHKNDVIANWGPPQSVMSDGSGGEIWVYSQNRQMTTPGYSQTNSYGSANTYGNAYANPYGASYSGNTSYNGSSYSTYTPAQTTSWTVSRTFFINSSGIVYWYAWKGY